MIPSFSGQNFTWSFPPWCWRNHCWARLAHVYPAHSHCYDEFQIFTNVFQLRHNGVAVDPGVTECDALSPGEWLPPPRVPQSGRLAFSNVPRHFIPSSFRNISNMWVTELATRFKVSKVNTVNIIRIYSYPSLSQSNSPPRDSNPVPSTSKSYPHLMEPKSSFPLSQAPATCPNSKPD